MITRLLLKNHLSFKNLELEFSPGLNVFTGVSGAGKSVLMNAILSAFGLKDASADVVEIDAFCKLEMDDISDEEPNVFKVLKQSCARYFLNSQSISKKALCQASSKFLKYLSAKESSELENSSLLELLDAFVKGKNFSTLKLEFQSLFKELQSAKAELNAICQDESHLEELKELASFEINKIESISPKIGELEELSELKKRLSKKDKIESAWAAAGGIFEYESAVVRALELCDIESAFFSDAMNELRSAKESVSFDDYSDDEIGAVLDRLENLSGLERRYGSIERALEILETRKNELSKYEKIEFEKEHLESRILDLEKRVNALAADISKERKKALPSLEKMLNEFLAKLYLNNLALSIENSSLSVLGGDFVSVNLGSANLKNISSGELNRLRLAFIATKAQVLGANKGVIILDEIDANLSGKEAMSIASVLLLLARHYQIFAISHQPQLSSKANRHFLVEKNNDISSVRILESCEQELELARMISGEHISQEAKDFAKQLLQKEK